MKTHLYDNIKNRSVCGIRSRTLRYAKSRFEGEAIDYCRRCEQIARWDDEVIDRKTVKLWNRRIGLYKFANGDYMIFSRELGVPGLEPRAVNKFSHRISGESFRQIIGMYMDINHHKGIVIKND